MLIQNTSLLLLSYFGYGVKIVSGSENKDVKAAISDRVFMDKYPRELARDIASEKIELIESILAEKEGDSLYKNTFVVEALEEQGTNDPKMILQSDVCEPLVTDMLVHMTKLAGLGEETLLDLYCNDYDRETMASVLMDKTNDMVKDVLYGNLDVCHEAFDMMKIRQKKNIAQALGDKASCEAEVMEELERLRQLESDERVNWGAATNAVTSVAKKYGPKIIEGATSCLLGWLSK